MNQAGIYDLAIVDNVPFGLSAGAPQFFALRIQKPDWKSWPPGQFVMQHPLYW